MPSPQRVEVPGAFALELDHPAVEVGLVKNGLGPPGFELRLPLSNQNIGILHLPDGAGR